VVLVSFVANYGLVLTATAIALVAFAVVRSRPAGVWTQSRVEDYTN